MFSKATKRMVCGVFFGLSPFIASAQDVNPYNGEWLINVMGEGGTPRTGKLTIENKGGVWKIETVSRKDPCVGRPSPIEVRNATAEELVFEVQTSKSLAGCDDRMVSVKREGDKTLKGTTTGDRPVTLTRE